MGYVECRSCSGLKKKFVMRNGIVKEYPCRACDGTGINQRLYSKYCEKCSAEIIYPRDAAFPPKYCKSCKEIIRAEKERKAAEWRVTKCKVCGAEIKYNIHWSKIPDTCKSCIEKERAKWKEKACKKCGATIKYNVGWSKIPELCKSCIEKEKAKWKETHCKVCGASIRYNTDWSRIPDTCKPCLDKEKAKWKTTKCEICGDEIRYSTDWDNVPKRCRKCKEEIKKSRDTQEYLIANMRARSSKTPVRSSKTRDNGTLYLRGNKYGQPIHVTHIYDDGYHVSWDAMPDGTTVNVHWTNHKTKDHTPPSDALI